MFSYELRLIIGECLFESESIWVLPDDKPLLEELNRRYRPVLIAFFMRRGVGYADAEDMVQDVFVRLANTKHQSFENTDAFVFQIAANLLKDRGRRLRTRNAAISNLTTFEEQSFEALDPARFFLGRERLDEVSQYLRELPEKTRNIFILFRLEGVSLAEIAASYQISTRAVQKHVAKALDHLVCRLEGEGKRT